MISEKMKLVNNVLLLQKKLREERDKKTRWRFDGEKFIVIKGADDGDQNRDEISDFDEGDIEVEFDEKPKKEEEAHPSTRAEVEDIKNWTREIVKRVKAKNPR